MEHISNLIVKRANKIMTKSQELVKQADIIPFLQLGKKLEGGGVQSTGTHTVKFLSDKVVKGSDPISGQERLEVEYHFEENGQEKKYRVPVKDKQGGLHYFVQRMADAEIGETIILEMKKRGIKNYIDFKRAVDDPKPIPADKVPDEDIPVIEDEPKVKKVVPLAEGGEVDIEEIDF